MSETALVLTDGFFRTPNAKTAHGLVRGPSRYRVAAIVDGGCAGLDAGEALGLGRRGIPIFESVSKALEELPRRPDHCLIGVATHGGRIPAGLRSGLVDAARAGLSLVNPLHQLLEEDDELVSLVRSRGGRILDLRKPPPARELRFWSGDVLGLDTPRVAVLGTDCAVGKRTTCSLVAAALAEEGVRAELVYTGQTGWLQGYRHGFVLDATPNDFVCGELERAILACDRDRRPDVIFIEGQSALRNPSGPCGAELILAGGARGVLLQHALGRKHFIDWEELGCRIPPLAEEVQLIRLLGASVWALCVNAGEAGGSDEVEARCRQLEEELGLPVVLPLAGGMPRLLDVLRRRLGLLEDGL